MHRKVRSETGASMVEGAFAALVLFTLTFAIIQFVFFVFALVDARNTAATGARRGEIAANNPGADYKILQTVRREAHLTSSEQVDRVVVYWAADINGKPPPACLTANNEGLGQGVKGSACNIYQTKDFQKWTDAAGSPANEAKRFDQFIQSKRDINWAATSRNVRRSGPPDYLGVTVVMKSKTVGTVIPIAKTFQSTTVAQLQASES